LGMVAKRWRLPAHRPPSHDGGRAIGGWQGGAPAAA